MTISRRAIELHVQRVQSAFERVARELFGPGVEVSVTSVDSISLNRRGKLRKVVSELGRREAAPAGAPSEG